MTRLDTGTMIRLAVLAVLGLVSLPVVAAVLDDQGTENWIFPVQLVVMAALGALLYRENRIVGVGLGLLCGLLGTLVFFVLISGFGGA